jgi:hypothetical protein
MTHAYLDRQPAFFENQFRHEQPPPQKISIYNIYSGFEGRVWIALWRAAMQKPAFLPNPCSHIIEFKLSLLFDNPAFGEIMNAARRTFEILAGLWTKRVNITRAEGMTEIGQIWNWRKGFSR